MDIQAVIKYLRVVRGMKSNTLRSIELWLKKLQFIETNDQFLDFIDNLSQTSSPTTVNAYIVAFHHYIDYLQYNDLPCQYKKIKTKRVHPSPVSDFLSPTEMKMLIEAHRTGKNAVFDLQMTYDTIFLFLSLTGARINECLMLKSCDVSIPGKFCWVTLKGGRRHKFVLPDQLAKRLNVSHEYVFPNQKGHPFDQKSVNEELKRRAKMVGIDPKRVHAHVFRHSFISLLLREGQDLTQIAKLVGHAKLDTTYKTYSHLLDDTLRNVVNHHPLVKEYLSPQEILKQDLESIKKLRIFNDERFVHPLTISENSIQITVAVK